jgi:hypothetical protein
MHGRFPMLSPSFRYGNPKSKIDTSARFQKAPSPPTFRWSSQRSSNCDQFENGEVDRADNSSQRTRKSGQGDQVI